MTQFPTRAEMVEAMRKAGHAQMLLMHFGEDGYKNNKELWGGIMEAALNALLKMLPNDIHEFPGENYYQQLKAMEISYD